MAETTTIPRRRSRERIGADTARVWARELDLRNPYAKSILLALANYMNEDGSAWPGIVTISRDTDISEETVTKRLRWLETIGAIAMLKCWVDENGRRNHDGRGKPTSSEIRFLFDADADAIEAAAHESVDGKPLRGAALASHESRVSPRPGGGLNGESDCGVSTLVAPDQPPTGRDAHIDDTNLEQEDSPQSPPLASRESQRAAAEEGKQRSEVGGWLTKFRATYPEPSNRPEVVASLAAGLTPEERKQAQRGAEGAKAARELATREKRKRPLVDPSKFLANAALWNEYERFAPPPPPPEIFVAFGSEEWRARAVRAAICGMRMPTPSDIAGQGKGAIFHRELEPGTLALAAHADEFGGVGTRNWPIIEKASTGADSKAHMTAEFAAWGQRIKDWTGNWPQADRLSLCDSQVRCQPCWCEVPFTFRGETKMVRGYKVGLRVPTPFPPAKGSGGSSTGPPIAELSDQDASDFIKSA